MVRIKCTARKSTGGRAPRKSLTTIGEKTHSFKPSERVQSSTVLGYAFNDGNSSSTNNSATNDLHKMPVFDMDNTDDLKEYMPNFTLSREPVVANIAEQDRRFLEKVVNVAKSSFKASAWVLIWEDPARKEVSWIPEEECFKPGFEEAYRSYSHIKRVLRDGKLNGCQVRGNKDTGQFGLVATEDLPECYPVGVETGCIWSFRQHEDWLIQAQDPMLGVGSLPMPAHLFGRLIQKSFKRNLQSGFVIDNNEVGNEMKHIDDNGWLHQGAGSFFVPTNVEAYVVLDLVRGLPTVMYFVKEGMEVKKGVELTMDWNCWKEISFLLIPCHALLSRVKVQKCEALRQECISRSIPLPTVESIDLRASSYKEAFLRPGDVQAAITDEMKAEFDEKTKLLYKVAFGPQTATSALHRQPKAKRVRPTAFRSLSQKESQDQDRFYGEAVRGSSNELSNKSREELDKLGAMGYTTMAADEALQNLRKEPVSCRIEVMEIVDIANPTCLYCLPIEKPYGVVAKRKIGKDEPILFYGGVLMDNEDMIDEFDAYLFDCDLPDDYKGKSIYIAGKDSIGGKINDPMSIGGTSQRRANVMAYHHFDGNNPQIIFYALRDIMEGEEILYEYGMNYWKRMYKIILMAHANFVARSCAECDLMEEKLGTGNCEATTI